MSETISRAKANAQLWEHLRDQDYRQGYAAGFASDFIASQITGLRRNRGWSQTQLAREAGVSQPQISGWESSCEGVRIDSLLKLAEAFDVALVVKFIPFSEMVRRELPMPADRPIAAFGSDALTPSQPQHIPFSISSVSRSVLHVDGAWGSSKRSHSAKAETVSRSFANV